MVNERAASCITADFVELSTPAGSLRVSFVRRPDRYQHAVSWLENSSATPVLMSEEGTAQQPWPTSPPLQQFSIEPREQGGSVALLLGMAGSSHWSLSVEVKPREQQIVFSAACRCHGPYEQLGSTYAVSSMTKVIDEATWWLDTQNGLRLSVPFAGPDASRVERVGNRLCIVPAVRIDDESFQKPRTIRWQYVVSCTDGSVERSR